MLKETVMFDMGASALALAKTLIARGLLISPKTALIASDPEIADHVQAILGSIGVHVRVVARMRDLGVDAGG